MTAEIQPLTALQQLFFSDESVPIPLGGIHIDIYQKVKGIAVSSGVWEADYLATKDLLFYPELREICKGNGCGNYGRSWACPPAVGTLEECRERLTQYPVMLLFSNKYVLEDSFDFEGMRRALLEFKGVVDLLQNNLKPMLRDFLLLSNEGCQRCAHCTYPEHPCRFPELLHHSIEGYGLNIGELAKKAQIRYYNGPNTVTFFGGLLFDGVKTDSEFSEAAAQPVETTNPAEGTT